MMYYHPGSSSVGMLLESCWLSEDWVTADAKTTPTTPTTPTTLSTLLEIAGCGEVFKGGQKKLC